MVEPRREDVDDNYEEYLWGEPTARAFARRALVPKARPSVRTPAKRVEDLLRP